MKDTYSLELKEITSIVINVISVKMLFTFPKRLIVTSGNAAWIQVIYMSLLVFGIVYITNLFYKKTGNISIIGLSEKIGGKKLKAIVGILVSVVLFLNLAATIRSFPEMVKMVLLPNTPIEIILIIFALVTAIAAYMGIEAIARVHSIYIPIIIVILLFFFVFLLPKGDINNLYPILGKGTQKIFKEGIFGISLFDDLLILNLLLPNIKNMEVAKKAGYRALTVSSIGAFIITLIYCLLYPYPSSQKFLVPIYQMARLIGIGDFFQRFEAFFEFIWSISIFLYSSICLAVLCKVWKDSFDLKYDKPIIFPMAAIITIVAFSSQSMQDMVYGYWYLETFILVIAFGFPILLSGIYNKKKKRL